MRRKSIVKLIGVMRDNKGREIYTVELNGSKIILSGLSVEKYLYLMDNSDQVEVIGQDSVKEIDTIDYNFYNVCGVIDNRDNNLEFRVVEKEICKDYIPLYTVALKDLVEDKINHHSEEKIIYTGKEFKCSSVEAELVLITTLNTYKFNRDEMKPEDLETLEKVLSRDNIKIIMEE